MGMFLSIISFLVMLVSTSVSSPVIKFQGNAAKGCVYNNVTYGAHTHFKPDPCTSCQCPRKGGSVKCSIQDCNWEPNCLKREKLPNECCGVCREYGCRHSDGKVYPFGAVIPSTPCEHCYCPENSIATVCVMVKCPVLKCVDPEHHPDRCCPLCPNGDTCRMPNGEVIVKGDSVQIDPCTTCTCDRSGWLGAIDGRATCHIQTCNPCHSFKRRYQKGRCCPLCV